MSNLRSLLVLDDNELFRLASESGAKRKKVYWAPVVFDAGCRTSPCCRHCKWESFKNNTASFGKRRSLDEVLRSAEEMLQAGATHLLAASGWMGYEIPDSFCEYMRAIKTRFDAEVYGLFGAISGTALTALQDAGMDGYQCGLESPDERIYRSFRPGGDSLSDRRKTLQCVKTAGLKIWSGFLLGFGLSDEGFLEGLEFLKGLSLDWIGIQPFVPFPHTRMQAEDPTNPYRWARAMAIARLYADEGCNIVATENAGAYANFLPLTGANGFFIFPSQQR